MSIDPDSPWQDPNPPVPGRRNARTILAVSGVALVVVVVGALVGTVLRDKSLSQFDDTLVFQPRNVTTADPFTPDLAGVDVPFSDQATQALNAERETMTYDTDARHPHRRRHHARVVRWHRKQHLVQRRRRRAVSDGEPGQGCGVGHRSSGSRPTRFRTISTLSRPSSSRRTRG